MKVSVRLLLAVGLSSLFLAGCISRTEEQQAAAGSGLHYITFGPGVQGLTGQVKKTEMRICLTGVSSTDRAKWEENIKSVVLKWVEPLRALSSDHLTSSVAVVSARESCEATVTVASGVWSNTYIGSKPTVNMDYQGYFASYKVLLHEFGHAFALSDTYQNGQSGNCQPGQPQAVMCNTSFDTPQPDDIEGLGEIFKNAFPNDVPGNPSSLSGRMYAAFSSEKSPGSFAMLLSYDKQMGSNGGDVAYCFGDETTCKSTGTWHTTKKLSVTGASSDVEFFETSTEVAPLSNPVMTMRYGLGSELLYQAIQFEATGAT